MSDSVNHPAHYAGTNGIECIDAIQAVLSPEEYRGFLRGQVLKYIWRARLKGPEAENYAKANWYLARLFDLAKKEPGHGGPER